MKIYFNITYNYVSFIDKLVYKALNNVLNVNIDNQFFIGLNKINDVYTFNIGLLDFVINFLRKEEVLEYCEFIDNRELLQNFSLDYHVGKYELYDYQKTVINKIFNNRSNNIFITRGIIDAATNSGKSFIIVNAIKNFIENLKINKSGKILVLAHSVEVFDELYKALLIEFDEQDIGIKNKKYNLLENKLINLYLYKTLSSRIDDYEDMLDIDLLIVDESHKVRGDLYFKLINSINTKYLYFFSGTALNVEDYHIFRMTSLAGSVISKISNIKLINLGISQMPMIDIEYIDSPYKAKSRLMTYEDVYQKHILSIRRCMKVLDSVAKCDGQTLIIVNYIEHGNMLLELAKDKYPDKTFYFISGNSSNRSEIKKKFALGEIDYLIVNKIFQEALNAKYIRHLIFAHSSKSIIWLLQFVGRALRSDQENSTVLITDFYDDLNYLRTHSNARIREYKKQNFIVNLKFSKKR